MAQVLFLYTVAEGSGQPSAEKLFDEVYYPLDRSEMWKRQPSIESFEHFACEIFKALELNDATAVRQRHAKQPVHRRELECILGGPATLCPAALYRSACEM